jgi:hypothetical protein
MTEDITYIPDRILKYLPLFPLLMYRTIVAVGAGFLMGCNVAQHQQTPVIPPVRPTVAAVQSIIYPSAPGITDPMLRIEATYRQDIVPAYRGMALPDIIKGFDSDRNGCISYEEMKTVMAHNSIHAKNLHDHGLANLPPMEQLVAKLAIIKLVNDRNTIEESLEE